jgi:hypothetical protein
MRPWIAPRFEEIGMNAEIGAYQSDVLDDAAPNRALVALVGEDLRDEIESEPAESGPEIAA